MQVQKLTQLHCLDQYHIFVTLMEMYIHKTIVVAAQKYKQNLHSNKNSEFGTESVLQVWQHLFFK